MNKIRYEKDTLAKFDERVRDWDASLTDIVQNAKSSHYDYDFDEISVSGQETVMGTLRTTGRFNDQGFRTMCNKIGAPAHWLKTDNCPPDLRGTIMNRLISDADKNCRFRFRETAGEMVCRAVLSERYMPYNHLDLWEAVKEGVEKSSLSTMKPRIWQPTVSDSMSFWVLFEGAVADPDENLPAYDGGGAGGLKPAIHVRNSEDGTGKIRLSGGLYRSYCTNGVIFGFSRKSQMQRIHVGNRINMVSAEVQMTIAQTAEQAGLGIDRYIESTKEHIRGGIDEIVSDWSRKYKISTELTDQWKGALSRVDTWGDLVMATSDFGGSMENTEKGAEFEEMAGEILFQPNERYVERP